MVVFFAGGTGHPYFSTDTTTVLRAVEIEAETILLAKAVDGVYDSDPKTNPEAKKYDEVHIQDCLLYTSPALLPARSIACSIVSVVRTPNITGISVFKLIWAIPFDTSLHT